MRKWIEIGFVIPDDEDLIELWDVAVSFDGLFEEILAVVCVHYHRELVFQSHGHFCFLFFLLYFVLWH